VARRSSTGLAWAAALPTAGLGPLAAAVAARSGLELAALVHGFALPLEGPAITASRPPGAKARAAAPPPPAVAVTPALLSTAGAATLVAKQTGLLLPAILLRDLSSTQVVVKSAPTRAIVESATACTTVDAR